MGIDYQNLSIAERIQLVQEILDSIADEVGSRAVPQWQMRELDRRLEEIEKNPRDAQPWDEVKAEILSEQAPAPSE
jgi:putative addiction module component (TIGR02574 family)